MDSQKDPQKDSKIKFSIGYVLVAILVLTLIRQFILGPLLMGSAEISYSEFKTALRQGEIKSVSVSEMRITGVRHDDSPFQTVRVEDPDLLAELEAQAVEIRGQVESDGGFLGALLGWILPLALMAGFYYFLMRRMKGGMGTGGMFDFGKSKARRIQGTEKWRDLSRCRGRWGGSKRAT